MTNETLRDKIAKTVIAGFIQHDATQNIADAILATIKADNDAKDKKIEELEAAIKRQAGAAKTLRNATLAEVQHIKDNERKEYIASQTLDSERDANAILTDENEALKARIAELKGTDQ